MKVPGGRGGTAGGVVVENWSVGRVLSEGSVGEGVLGVAEGVLGEGGVLSVG